MQIKRKEIKKLLEVLDIRKVMRLDEMKGWIFKECKEEMEKPYGI